MRKKTKKCPRRRVIKEVVPEWSGWSETVVEFQPCIDEECSWWQQNGTCSVRLLVTDEPTQETQELVDVLKMVDDCYTNYVILAQQKEYNGVGAGEMIHAVRKAIAKARVGEHDHEKEGCRRILGGMWECSIDNQRSKEIT